MLGHVKLNNNPEERSQGWYYLEKGTKNRLHHEQIEIFAKQLKDSHNLTNKAVAEDESLPNHKSVRIGPSDLLENISIPSQILQGADSLDLNFACDTFRAADSPQKLPKLKISGFIADILYDLGDEDDESNAASMEELETFITSFNAATTEEYWTGVVHCSFQQMEQVLNSIAWPLDVFHSKHPCNRYRNTVSNSGITYWQRMCQNA